MSLAGLGDRACRGWYSEQRNSAGCEWYLLEVSVTVAGGVRGSGKLLLPDGVEVCFDHKPGHLRKGWIQSDGSIAWDNGKTWMYGGAGTWTYGDACAQRRWSTDHSLATTARDEVGQCRRVVPGGE